MNTRELWNTIMNYGDVNRVPVMHWKGWPETHERWIQEGMPPDVSEHDYFGVPPCRTGVGVNVALYPPFEEEVIEETQEYRIFKQHDGVIVKDWKHKSCIPHFIDYTLTAGEQWDEYKKRLQPDPDRIPDNLKQQVQESKNADIPVTVPTGSMIGWIRNWMGVTQMSYLAFDDRELFREMVDTIADLVIWGLEQVLPDAEVDAGWGWEDVCFRTGPLISPDIFEDVAVPAYSRISETLRSYGVDLYVVDCDGLIDDLIPGWLRGGVNVMFPLEIGAWKADPMSYRKQYGRELRIFGGIDKLELEKGKDAIDAEIQRRRPFMKEGGFVPLPDHLITPDTPLEDYKYYLKKMNELRL